MEKLTAFDSDCTYLPYNFPRVGVVEAGLTCVCLANRQVPAAYMPLLKSEGVLSRLNGSIVSLAYVSPSLAISASLVLGTTQPDKEAPS